MTRSKNSLYNGGGRYVTYSTSHDFLKKIFLVDLDAHHGKQLLVFATTKMHIQRILGSATLYRTEYVHVPPHPSCFQNTRGVRSRSCSRPRGELANTCHRRKYTILTNTTTDKHKLQLSLYKCKIAYQSWFTTYVSISFLLPMRSRKTPV